MLTKHLARARLAIMLQIFGQTTRTSPATRTPTQNSPTTRPGTQSPTSHHHMSRLRMCRRDMTLDMCPGGAFSLNFLPTEFQLQTRLVQQRQPRLHPMPPEPHRRPPQRKQKQRRSHRRRLPMRRLKRMRQPSRQLLLQPQALWLTLTLQTNQLRRQQPAQHPPPR